MIVSFVHVFAYFPPLFSVFSASKCVDKCVCVCVFVCDCSVRLPPPSYDEVVHDSEAASRPPVHE